MKRNLLISLVLTLVITATAEEPISSEKSPAIWFEIEGQPEEISAAAIQLIERVQTDMKAINAIQASAYDSNREWLSSNLSELGTYIQHDCAMLKTVSDNVKFTSKLTNPLRKEFAFIVMHSSYTMDDVFLVSRTRVNNMVGTGTGEEAVPTLRALQADLEAIRQLSWRIKCVPAPRKR